MWENILDKCQDLEDLCYRRRSNSGGLRALWNMKGKISFRHHLGLGLLKIACR